MKQTNVRVVHKIYLHFLTTNVVLLLPVPMVVMAFVRNERQPEKKKRKASGFIILISEKGKRLITDSLLEGFLRGTPSVLMKAS